GRPLDAEIDHRHAVGVPEAAHGLGLGLEPGEKGLLRGDPGVQELHRHRPPQLHPLPLVDDPHRAGGELGEDAIPTLQHVTDARVGRRRRFDVHRPPAYHGPRSSRTGVLTGYCKSSDSPGWITFCLSRNSRTARLTSRTSVPSNSPCPALCSGKRRLGTPARSSAACNRLAWAKGTTGSASPWAVKIGGAPFPT